MKYLLSAALCTAMLSACSSEENVQESALRVPLEVSVGPNAVRSIIEGTTIPTQTSFGIFGVPAYSPNAAIVEDINNVQVFYDGKCTLKEDVWLDEKNIYLRAYYPYNKNQQGFIIHVDYTDQTDYLCGGSVLAGEPYCVNNQHPKADIQFNHVLSRITLKIKRTDKVKENFKLAMAGFEPFYESAQLDVLTGTWSEQKESGYPYTTFQVFPMSMEVTNEYHSVDFLLIPGIHSDVVTLRLYKSVYDYDTCTLMKVNWKAGQQYTYEVVFDENGINVSEAVITPWETTTESEITVTDDDLLTE